MVTHFLKIHFGYWKAPAWLPGRLQQPGFQRPAQLHLAVSRHLPHPVLPICFWGKGSQGRTFPGPFLLWVPNKVPIAVVVLCLWPSANWALGRCLQACSHGCPVLSFITNLARKVLVEISEGYRIPNIELQNYHVQDTWMISTLIFRD